MRHVSAFVLVLLAPGEPVAAEVKVSHEVDPIAQPSEMSCWAAATTMLVDWKAGLKRTVPQVVGLAGARFSRICQASFGMPPQGIMPADEEVFHKAL